jgi:hypothetical protein
MFQQKEFKSVLNELTLSYPVARGSVVVKALCYKQDGHGFET